MKGRQRHLSWPAKSYEGHPRAAENVACLELSSPLRSGPSACCYFWSMPTASTDGLPADPKAKEKGREKTDPGKARLFSKPPGPCSGFRRRSPSARSEISARRRRKRSTLRRSVASPPAPVNPRENLSWEATRPSGSRSHMRRLQWNCAAQDGAPTPAAAGSIESSIHDRATDLFSLFFSHKPRGTPTAERREGPAGVILRRASSESDVAVGVRRRHAPSYPLLFFRGGIRGSADRGIRLLPAHAVRPNVE